MRSVGLLPMLLLGLVLGQVRSYAEPGVTLTVCNAGKIDIDAYLVRQSSALTSHISPAKCAVLEQKDGPAAPGILGFGLSDAKGQWGGARRTAAVDTLDDAFEPARQTLPVKHGAANASVPGLISYQPAAPFCDRPSSITPGRPRPTTTAGRIADAVAGSSTTPSGAPICHSQSYSLTVVPYADSREIELDKRCDPCESPDDRAAAEQAEVPDYLKSLGDLPGIGGILGKGIVNLNQKGIDDEKQDRARRAAIARGPYQMNWKDLSSFITSAFGMQGPLLVNRHIILRGAISRVQMPDPGAQIPSVHVYFKEASTMEKPIAQLPGDYFITKYIGTDQTFGMCTTDQSILSEIFGANFATAMVGKTVELEGEVNGGVCGTAAGVQVVLARQVKVVTPGMAMAKGQTWVPVLRQPQQPAAPAVSATRAPAAPTAPPAIMSPQEAARAAAARPVNRTPAQPAPSPAPVSTASVAPARVPVAPAPPAPAPSVRDPLINNVVSLLKAKTQEIQIMLMLKRRNRPVNLTAADRGELEDAGASEKLIEAMLKPASIGPEVTPEAVAAAAREKAAPQRQR